VFSDGYCRREQDLQNGHNKSCLMLAECVIHHDCVAKVASGEAVIDDENEASTKWSAHISLAVQHVWSLGQLFVVASVRVDTSGTRNVY